MRRGARGAAAGDIRRHLEIPASTVSHHVERLTSAGLLAGRRDGTFIYYAPDLGALRALTDFLWGDCCRGGDSDR